MAAVNQSASLANNSSFLQSEAHRGVQIAATLLIFMIGVPLNGLVVWALAWRYGGRGDETRAASSFRVYVLNLALADLVLLLRTPLMLGYLAHNYSWPFGLAFCKMVMFLRVLGLYASAFLLCAVALERCVCILRPFWARLRRPPWAVPLACGVLWVVAALLAAPYLQSAVLLNVTRKYKCKENKSPDLGMFITETTVGFILPLLVFLGSNLAVLLVVKQVVPLAPSSSPSSSRQMLKLYRVLFFTMLLFLTCWVPYFLSRFIRTMPGADWLKHGAEYTMYISLFLVYVKSSLNPLLYVFGARDLSRSVRASVGRESSGSIRQKSLKSGK